MSGSKVDFGRLSLKDALDLAIFVEEQAYERYVEFAQQLTTQRTLDAAGFFRYMADTEAGHGAELRGRRRQLFGDQPCAVSPEQVRDVEAPERGAAQAGMTPQQALELALRAEQSAHAFFDSALAHVHNRRVRKLFAELRDEELHHQELVRRELARLPVPLPDGQLVGR